MSEKKATCVVATGDTVFKLTPLPQALYRCADAECGSRREYEAERLFFWNGRPGYGREDTADLTGLTAGFYCIDCVDTKLTQPPILVDRAFVHRSLKTELDARLKALESWVRPEVQAFAFSMERRLRANDHKGGWQYESDEYLLESIFDELTELTNAPIHEIENEAADIGNFAMMMRDNADRKMAGIYRSSIEPYYDR